MPSLSLRFENMPERHAELAWRFGEPDECRNPDAEAAGADERQGSAWALHSPLSPEADLAAHLRWAAECLGPHEAFVGELVSLGGRAVVRMACGGGATGSVLRWNARLLLPMAHAGMEIEFEILGPRAAGPGAP